MLTEIESKVEKKLTLKLNSLKPQTKTISKIYQIICDSFTVRFVECDILKVSDGKTRYSEKDKCLQQSKRYILNNSPFKVDIFDNDAETINCYTHLKDGREYDLILYYFTDKDQALKRYKSENFKLLVRKP